MATRPEEAARDVADNPWMRRVARAGFVASGLVHLILGGIAIQVALGGGGSADSGGALRALGSAPGGAIVLAICAVGFAALAVFQLLIALVGSDEIKDRLKGIGKGCLYGFMAVSAARYALGTGGGGEGTTGLTGRLMSVPFGRVIVAALGVAIVIMGIYHVYKGLSRKFLEDLHATGAGNIGRGITVTGMAGYSAKGIALTIIGLLFGLAAWQADPKEATGMDGALKTLAQQPYGTVLLLVVAVGLFLYGLYSIARARYANLD